MLTATKAQPISYDINLPYDELPGDTDLVRSPTSLRVKDASVPELHKAGIEITHITPGLGSYISGIQLNQLSDVAKDELAHLIAQRKVLAFENQDLIDDGPAAQQEFMNYYGNGYPGFQIIQRDGNKEELARFLEQRPTTTLWHQDVSYEIQPPGYVILGYLQVSPEVGGDTLFTATYTAYKRLSPTMQSFPPLGAHTSRTGERCPFINGDVVTKIEGLKEPGFRVLQELLMQHMITGLGGRPGVWWGDAHTAVVDYIDEDESVKLRHLFRLAAMAENPIPVGQA
ncbi:uncharacterized protein BCR38DRAFT_467821 [Pseudomassariella vexata]|uniref:TauD/TfdA-like domain-containing protein n=1 Tax=Pseudomassariella vexata TaxID=1141098 RepID=A0A1Y2DNV0_9PEZI|nr:uncharacterized protein BCR38DRAFT_467821 [Pseudomassariella vexata]ORY60844.1 hypothetical protein BCR38DRAFT_467821 [Pseudomassariella vexata]